MDSSPRGVCPYSTSSLSPPDFSSQSGRINALAQHPHTSTMGIFGKLKRSKKKAQPALGSPNQPPAISTPLTPSKPALEAQLARTHGTLQPVPSQTNEPVATAFQIDSKPDVAVASSVTQPTPILAAGEPELTTPATPSSPVKAAQWRHELARRPVPVKTESLEKIAFELATQQTPPRPSAVKFSQSESAVPTRPSVLPLGSQLDLDRTLYAGDLPTVDTAVELLRNSKFYTEGEFPDLLTMYLHDADILRQGTSSAASCSCPRAKSRALATLSANG